MMSAETLHCRQFLVYYIIYLFSHCKSLAILAKAIELGISIDEIERMYEHQENMKYQLFCKWITYSLMMKRIMGIIDS